MISSKPLVKGQVISFVAQEFHNFARIKMRMNPKAKRADQQEKARNNKKKQAAKHWCAIRMPCFIARRKSKAYYIMRTRM